MSVTSDLAAFVAGLDAAALPSEVAARTRLLVLDLVDDAILRPDGALAFA